MEKLKILIVDDNKNNLVTLNALLEENLDVTVVECQSGITALEVLIQESIDLCILDVQMPDIDGFELAKLIRNRKKTSHIPIILLTAAYLSDKYRQKGFEIGAEDYITKPINDTLLINRIRAYLRPIQKERAFSSELEKKVTERTIELQNQIEKRKKIEKELILSKEKAEKEAKDKSMFLSTMSHEIRTPMNGILAILRLILEDNPKPEHVESLRIMKFSSDNMMAIINDILDFNKIEAGKVTLENIDFNLLELVASVKFAMNVKALEKGIEVISEISKDIPDIIVGDPVRLGQILNNLVTNAVKFTDKGSVTIKIELLETREDSFYLGFSVTDTGIGIPSDKLESIFEVYTQASEDTTRKYGGTGLGLSITKNLVELMSGEIKVESALEKGSKFSFEIEVKKSIKTKETMREKNMGDLESLKELKVLVAEDNKVNQMVANKLLKKWGIEADFAENGIVAVEKVKNNSYDIILMDLQMPEMDGYQATKEIRKFNSEVPIFALTASTLDELDVDINMIGMNDILTKPFIPEEFHKKLLKVKLEKLT